MQNEEDRVPENADAPSTEGAGLEQENSNPDLPSENDELTVEDILAAEQSEGQPEEQQEDSPYLEDLRRVTAEFANYRKRTEANRDAEARRARATVIEPLLGVLDDLDRAEQHGDLTPGSAFLAIAQKFRTTLEKLGLEGFGEVGEVFDPQHHEAIAQVPVPGTEEQSVLDVIERGYRIGDVELRPAKVAVAVSADG